MPVITGGVVEVGMGPFGATTAVGAEVALVAPYGFRAVTWTRSVCPRSSVPSWCACPVAMSLQLPPEASQRRQRYENEIGPAPVHVPDVAITVSPCFADPWITGSAVFTGAPLETTALGPETAFAEPSAFVAVTETRRV